LFFSSQPGPFGSGFAANESEGFEMSGKRTVSDTGYEVIHAVEFGDREMLVAVNMNDPDGRFYMKAEYRDNGLIGEYSRIVYSSNYLAVMEEFIGAIDQKIIALRNGFEKADYQAAPITVEDCLPHDCDWDLRGEIVAIKAEALRPEYRRGDVQLVEVKGGNGALPNPRGSSVYCCHLSDGEHARFERRHILGVIKELPDWAKERLAAIKAEREAEAPEPETNAGYTITERITAGGTLFVLGEAPNQRYVTWQRAEGHEGYDHGHYFDNRERAAADLHKRAALEEQTFGHGGRNTKDRGDAR
jgi:hypothetical protein